MPKRLENFEYHLTPNGKLALGYFGEKGYDGFRYEYGENEADYIWELSDAIGEGTILDTEEMMIYVNLEHVKDGYTWEREDLEEKFQYFLKNWLDQGWIE
jgi:hypothetical protein